MARDTSTLMVGQYFKRRREMVEVLLVAASGLGMFYRSATLYHPQRRAILHLKNQKRKIKDKNKAQEEKLPFFDFSSLKSRTFQIILLSSSIISVGMFTPFLLLITDP